MLTPFMKLGKSYIDIRSIERMKKFDGSVEIWFKHTRGSWNYKGEKYDIDKIAKRIEAFYRQIPKHKEEELERFEILDL
jgi:hypothetical protein